MKKTNIKKLLNKVNHLKSLLEDPHPGLSTWREAYLRTLSNISEWYIDPKFGCIHVKRNSDVPSMESLSDIDQRNPPGYPIGCGPTQQAGCDSICKVGITKCPKLNTYKIITNHFARGKSNVSQEEEV